MTKKSRSENRFPVKAVLITALVTLALCFGAAYILGYVGPRYNQSPDQGPDALVQGQLLGENNKAQLYTCGMHPWIITEEPGTCPICGMDLTPKRDAKGSGSNAATDGGERKIAYWQAPMNPMEIYDEPGKSKMGMDLVPVYEDDLIGGVSVIIDPATEQNMGVRTAEVKKGPLVHTIRTYGHVTYNETRTAEVSPKVNGWFEKLHVDFTGEMVEKGQPLYEIYAPELVAVQEEYLAAIRNQRRMSNDQSRDMLDSARRRLDFFDVAESEIKAIRETGEVRKTILIRSPFKGVVTHKNAVEGAYVKAGTTVYKIADLSTVWVEAHIYEYELARVEKGQEAVMTLPYIPGRSYHGKVAYIYPFLQQKTRDVILRLEFENPNLSLKPDMYADVSIETVGEGEGIIVPSEAVIRSGQRNVAFVARGGGEFTPREVQLGLSLDEGRVQVLAGLAPGETVVTSGQFMLDSESNLKEAIQKMMAAKTKPAPSETVDSNPQPKPGAGAEDDFFKDMEPRSEPNSENDFFKDLQ